MLTSFSLHLADGTHTNSQRPRHANQTLARVFGHRLIRGALKRIATVAGGPPRLRHGPLLPHSGSGVPGTVNGTGLGAKVAVRNGMVGRGAAGRADAAPRLSCIHPEAAVARKTARPADMVPWHVENWCGDRNQREVLRTKKMLRDLGGDHELRSTRRAGRSPPISPTIVSPSRVVIPGCYSANGRRHDT